MTAVRDRWVTDHGEIKEVQILASPDVSGFDGSTMRTANARYEITYGPIEDNHRVDTVSVKGRIGGEDFHKMYRVRRILPVRDAPENPLDLASEFGRDWHRHVTHTSEVIEYLDPATGEPVVGR